MREMPASFNIVIPFLKDRPGSSHLDLAAFHSHIISSVYAISST